MIAGTLAVYYPVHSFGFVNYDDPSYVYDNPNVKAGLSIANLKWAFTTVELSNYHPLTWISLLLDTTLFGINPHAMHVENVLLHIASSILLLVFFERATGDFWPSAFAAAVFAIHPTHVESVAWIVERKDVLSTLLLLLALIAYLSCVRSPPQSGRWAYVRTLLLYACGLLCKPMLVTFPFLLLLLDAWPLRRFGRDSASGKANAYRLITEKIPFLILAAVSSVVTYIAQQSIAAPLNKIPLSLRYDNAALSYAAYLGKFVWPTTLSVLYPYRWHPPVGGVISATVLLLALTLLCWKLAKSRRYLIFGWLWFLGSMVPVIGIVQVGAQSMADRYLYIPSIGLIVIVAWAGQDVSRRAWRWLLPMVSAAVLVSLALLCRHQVEYWRDGETLFRHASLVLNGNAVAEVRWGYEAALRGDTARAKQYYLAALKVDPTNSAAEFNLGNLALREDPKSAVEWYRRAAVDDPSSAPVQTNWGVALRRLNDPAGAFEHFRIAVQLAPDDYDAHYNLGQLWLMANRLPEARGEFQMALQARPDDPAATKGLQESGSPQHTR